MFLLCVNRDDFNLVPAVFSPRKVSLEFLCGAILGRWVTAFGCNRVSIDCIARVTWKLKSEWVWRFWACWGSNSESCGNQLNWEHYWEYSGRVKVVNQEVERFVYNPPPFAVGKSFLRIATWLVVVIFQLAVFQFSHSDLLNFWFQASTTQLNRVRVTHPKGDF